MELRHQARQKEEKGSELQAGAGAGRDALHGV